MTWRASLGAWACLVTVAACGGTSGAPDGAPDPRADSGLADGATRCPAACDDGVFCNGVETCDPDRGCVEGSVPCMAGQTCSERERRCVTEDCTPPNDDADGDGQRSLDCGGSDCDDGNPQRFAGNIEICDPADVDEDCDPTTFGVRDLDMDGEPDAQCCNVAADGSSRCGTDCDDTRASVSPVGAEICDGRDNDCDGRTDEEVSMTFWPDADGDSYGDPAGTTVTGCMAPMGYAGRAGDCDDGRTGVNPGVGEVCDVAGLDENCDGRVNPPEECECTNGAARPCALPGACGGGTELCVDGHWAGACSITPVAESCNGIDDDCDSVVDNGLTVVCYTDSDNDGYPGAGALRVDVCPNPARSAVGGCPNFTTNRAPLDPNVDCADDDVTRRPGATELCNAIDDDCDGVPDEGLRVACYVDIDNDTYAALGAMMTMECPSPDRIGVGGCPLSTTNRVPTAGNADCADMDSGRRPGATEVCTSGVRTDDDCDGLIDEGVSVACYVDDDGDGYAAAGATSSMQCRADTRPAFGFCPIGFVARAPVGASNTDCAPMNAAVNPGAAEQCDAAMVDENCDGVANPATLCMCSGSETRACSHVGAQGVCATGTVTCTSGAWGACSISAVPETCDGRDEDCNGVIDDGLRVTCYPDADDDGYAPAGASASTYCPVTGRSAVGGCPTNTTNRAPGIGTTDCNDTTSAVRPGAPETCTDAGMAADEDCDGLTDEGLRLTCYADVDGDTYAPTSSGSTSRCRDGSAARMAYGYCPTGYTNRAPTSGMADCNDGSGGAAFHPGAMEVCDRIDHDCSSGGGAALDEDADGDGHAPIGAMCSGGFPSDDCNDTRSDTYPGAPEACDRWDANCSSGGGTALDEDADGDGHAPPSAPCVLGPLPRDDCDDTRSNRFPGQTAYIPEPICAPGVPIVSCGSTLACGGCGPSTCVPSPCPPPNLHDYDCDGTSTPQASYSSCPGGFFCTYSSVPTYSGLTGYLCGRVTDIRQCAVSGGFCMETAYVVGGGRIGCR